MPRSFRELLGPQPRFDVREPYNDRKALLDAHGGEQIGTGQIIPPDVPGLSLINLRADDLLTHSVALAFSVDESMLGVLDVPRLIAHVGWGAGGARHELDADVCTGACLALSCSSLQVAVENRGTGSPLVRATVGYGLRGEADTAPRLSFRSGAPIAPAATMVARVPAFASTVFVGVVPFGAWHLDVLDRAGVVMYQAPTQPVMFGWIPLSEQARAVKLTNDGAAWSDAVLMFGLNV